MRSWGGKQGAGRPCIEYVFYCKVTVKSFKVLTKRKSIMRLQFKKDCFGSLVEEILCKESTK